MPQYGCFLIFLQIYLATVLVVRSTVFVHDVSSGVRRPRYIRLLKENFQRRPPRALQWRATVLARLTGWRWRIQGGVQTQSGDQGNGFTEGLAAVEQIQHGIAVVAHQHQGSVGQPAWFGRLTMSGVA